MYKVDMIDMIMDMIDMTMIINCPKGMSMSMAITMYMVMVEMAIMIVTKASQVLISCKCINLALVTFHCWLVVVTGHQ